MEFDKTRYAGVVPPIQDQLDPPNPVLGLWRIRAWSCFLFREKHRKGEYWSYRQSHCVIVATIQVLLVLCEEKERPMRPLPRVFQIGSCLPKRGSETVFSIPINWSVRVDWLDGPPGFVPCLYLAVVKQDSLNLLRVWPRAALVLRNSCGQPKPLW